MLTCSHCFGDVDEESQITNRQRWLLFFGGQAVQVDLRSWDPKRDLALCRIIAIESDIENSRLIPAFSFIPLSPSPPSPQTPIICIGQPGSEDLESTSVRRTKYNLVEISEGTFRGLVPNADPQDNYEIGTLMHDAWTYWGHSGAPFVERN